MKIYNSPDLNDLPIKNPLCYSSEDINELFDLSEEEAVELTKVIDDSHVAINKVYSNSKTEERLAEILIEANQFATEQLGKSNFLSIDVVTSTDDVLDDTVIYLIDDGTSTNTYNQYVLINGVVTPLGSTQCDLTNYVTNEKLEEKLEDYAKKDEVLNASDIVTTIDENSTDTTVPSSATVKTFVEDSLPEIVTTLDDTVTDEQIPSALATYNATKDMNMKTYTTVEQLGLSFPCTVGDIYLAMDGNSVAYICVEALASSVTDAPYSYGLLTISKRVAGRFTILYSLSTGGSVAKNRIWIGQLKGTDGTGLVWEELLTSDNGYRTTNQTVINGTTTDVTTLPLGHYTIATGSSTSMNLPFDDTTNYNGTLFIIGRLNDPTNNRGYRVMLYFDNKSRSAINHEWWGTYMGWKIITARSYKLPDVAKKSVELADKTKFTSGSVAYMVRDGICYVSISGLTIGNLVTSENNNIVTGLPTCNIYTVTSATVGASVNVSSYSYPFNIAIDNNSSTVYLRTSNTNAKDVKLYASFSYPVVE